MIAYGTVGAADMAVSMKFYDAALGALGAGCFYSGDGFAGYRVAENEPMLWVCHPFNKETAKAGNGVMIGFRARTRAEVDAFHAAALANGGTCEGPPGPRDYGPDMYLAYVRDPVGNKLSAVCSTPG